VERVRTAEGGENRRQKRVEKRGVDNPNGGRSPPRRQFINLHHGETILYILVGKKRGVGAHPPLQIRSRTKERKRRYEGSILPFLQG